MYLSFFLCFFVSKITSKINGWTDLHEIVREGVEWPWDDLITFFVNSEKPRDAQHGDGVCCAFAPQLVRPLGTAVPDGLKFYRRCFLFFFSPRFLRDPSTDRPETLPHDQNLAAFYKLTSKIRGVLPPKKISGPKTCKISVNFWPLQTLIANISGTRQHIQNRKDVRTRKIPPAFNEKSPVNFGPLTAWNYMWVWTH